MGLGGLAAPPTLLGPQLRFLTGSCCSAQRSVSAKAHVRPDWQSGQILQPLPHCQLLPLHLPRPAAAAVSFKLGKYTGSTELAEQLHQLLFRRKGAAATRKRDIMDFSGFAFEEEDKVRCY